MSRLLKNIAWDIFLTWPLIYFGLFMQNVYAYNMAVAFFWFISIGGIIAAISTIASDEMLKKAAARYKKPLWVHKKYGAITSFCEIAAMFAMGYFWLGGFYATSVILMMAMKEKVAEEAEK